jgi:predicted ester cyclase
MKKDPMIRMKKDPRILVLAVALILAGRQVAAVAQAEAPAGRSAHEQVVLSYFHDVLDGRRVALLDDLFLPMCVIHRPEGTVKGLAGIRTVVERNIAAYSKFQTEVHDIFEAGDRVVVRITHRAAGAGMFRSRIGDHDVKGKAVTWGAIAIFRMQDGKIAEEWVNRDELGILLSAGAFDAKASVR